MGGGQPGGGGLRAGGHGLGGGPGEPILGSGSPCAPLGSHRCRSPRRPALPPRPAPPHRGEPPGCVVAGGGGFALFAGPFPRGGAPAPISSLRRRFSCGSGGCATRGLRGLRRPRAPRAAPGPGGSMGGARDAGWVAAGLLLGAGACYCIYRLTRGQRRGGPGLRLRPSRSAGEASGNRGYGGAGGDRGRPRPVPGAGVAEDAAAPTAARCSRWDPPPRREGGPGAERGSSTRLGCGSQPGPRLPFLVQNPGVKKLRSFLPESGVAAEDSISQKHVGGLSR